MTEAENIGAISESEETGLPAGSGATGETENEAAGETESGVAGVTGSEEASLPAREITNPQMAAFTASEAVADMRLGWSLGNTMDATNPSAIKLLAPITWETAWGNPETTPELFEMIYGLGFNVFRIPVSWADHLLVLEDYKIVDSWMDRVQEIVDYAYDTGAYVILNLHHEDWHDPYYDNQDRAELIMRKVWTQIADRFADYEERLIFEGLNEPRKRGTGVEWNGGDQEGWDVVGHLNQVFVDTIRGSGGLNPYRILMVTPYAANAWEAPKHFLMPDDEMEDKLIVSIHAYEPYDFALRVGGPGNWNGDTSSIDTFMGGLDEIFIKKGIPVIIGEFGAMYKDAEGNEADRGAWAKYYVSRAAKSGIPCVWWDNGAFTGSGELFGLFNRVTYETMYPLVLQGLLEGAGIME